MSNLFRPEVVRNRQERINGSVIIASPKSYQLLALIVGVVMLAISIFLLNSVYARKTRLAAKIIPDRGIIRILPTSSGIVDEIAVVQGQQVSEGQHLVTIKKEILSTTGVILEERLRKQTLEDIVRLQEEKRNRVSQAEIDEQSVLDELGALREKRRRTLEQMELEKQSMQIEQELYDRFLSLVDFDAASSLELSNQRKLLLNSKKEIKRFENEIAEIGALLKTVKSKLSSVPLRLKAETISIDKEISEKRAGLINLNASRGHTITSPVDGKIMSLTVKRGSTVDTDKALLAIMPKSSVMQLEVYIPLEIAGQIKEDQPVNIRYDAFPYQQFGTFSGQIAEISSSAIPVSDLSNEVNTTNEPVFVANVKLDKQSIRVGSSSYYFQPGMTASAEIILDQRKIYNWIVPELKVSKSE